MAHSRRMGLKRNAGGSKRLPRHLRNEDLPTDTFTPRTYQVELLDSALHRNTIVCMSSSSGRTFIAVMVIKEMTVDIRKPIKDGGKRSIYLVDKDDLVAQTAEAIHHPSNLAVSPCMDSRGIDHWTVDRWTEEIERCQVLVLTAATFQRLLEQKIHSLSSTNVIILDDCHLVLDEHPYIEIMKKFHSCSDEEKPRILGLTSWLLSPAKCRNPQDLADTIATLEERLESVAETSTLVISERYGLKPKEQILECDDYEDGTGLNDELGGILESAIDYLEECSIETTPELDNRDPRLIPKAALIECCNILYQLGPWCAACLADMLVTQIEKIEKQKEFIALHKKFLKFAATNLRMVSKIFDNHFKTCDYSIDELLSYSTPKVTTFMNCLRKYRPETDFVIISEDIDENGLGSDSEMSDGISDFSDLESDDGDDDGNQSPNSRQIHIAIKKPTNEKSVDNLAAEEDKFLCGIIFIEHQHAAYALNKFIEEVCAWDDNLCFVKSSHITGHAAKSKGKETRLFKKQEEVLRKFRMQELNLLVSTNVLEEGVDVPKCNLVVRFDPPKSYRSYSMSKGRARARDSEFIILIEEEYFDEFEPQLKVYKDIEKVLTSRCEIAEEKATENVSNGVNVLPSYSPSSEEGAPHVTMGTAIALVNRYCAKLPSDAFTHLTPSCNIREVATDGEPGYIVTLRLPINSPIKDEVEGVAMPTKLQAKQAVALKMCEILHKKGELDEQLMPVGKEMFQHEEDDIDWDDEEDNLGEARPGTTKRKQYYSKKIASSLLQSHPRPDVCCNLYKIDMQLTGAITDDQNTRGRRIYAPEETPRSFGILTSKDIPLVPRFPVYTRSGEVTVSIDLLRDNVTLTSDDLHRLQGFQNFLFSNVLRLEKDPMDYHAQQACMGYIIMPLNKEDEKPLDIDWEFTDKIAVEAQATKPIDHFVPANVEKQSKSGKADVVSTSGKSTNQSEDSADQSESQKSTDQSIPEKSADKSIPEKSADQSVPEKYADQSIPKTSADQSTSDQSVDKSDKMEETNKFQFIKENYEDAVVMPSYRNIDQPQYFYVAEIRHDLNPGSPFPSPELYKTFAAYYTTKYGLTITNMEQPLLDVDHTSARLNLLIPRYMNQKGVALPTSSAETKKARRENLQQKQILVPELCDIHVFLASLWRKAVCLPAILYRMNYLLLAEEIRKHVALETKIGVVELPEGFQFPQLDFGFDTSPENLKSSCAHDLEDETDVDQKETDGLGEQSSNDTKVDVEKKEENEESVDQISEAVTDIKILSPGKGSDKSDVLSSSKASTHANENTTEQQDMSETNAVAETKSVHDQAELISENNEKLNNEISANDKNSAISKSNEVYLSNDQSPIICDTLNAKAVKSANTFQQNVAEDNNMKEISITDPAVNVSSTVNEKQSKHTVINCQLSECESCIEDICIDFSNVTSDESSLKCANEKVETVIIKSEQPDRDASTKRVSSNQNTSINNPVKVQNVEVEDLGPDDLDENNEPSKTPSQVSMNSLSADLEHENLPVDIISKIPDNSSNVNSWGDSELDIGPWNGNMESGAEIWSGGDNKAQPETSADEHHISNDGITVDAGQLIGKPSNSQMIVEPAAQMDSQTKTSVSENQNKKDGASSSDGISIIDSPNASLVNNHDGSEALGNIGEAKHEIECEKITKMNKENKEIEQIATTLSDIFENVSHFVDKIKEPENEDYNVSDLEPLTLLDEDIDLTTYIGPSPCIILQALTMSNANDFFSLERLETIGDSFLKYAITVYLYCSYPGIHEGKLSYLRSKQVSNYNLYRLGKKKSIAECMISTKFEPYENWLPPGFVVNEDKRKGPVPKVLIASYNNKNLSNVPPGITGSLSSQCSSDSLFKLGEDLSRLSLLKENEITNFTKELEETAQILKDEELETGDKSDSQNLLTCYSLQVHHSIPDKSIADCVEALIGCYLTSCGKMAALKFMSWMGLKVLPRREVLETRDRHEDGSSTGFGELACPPSPLLRQSKNADQILKTLLNGYEDFEAKIGYTFRDRSYLLQAFTHASYHYNTVTDCYQRLEFLGDAILDYVITRHLYEDSDKYSPGVLTDLRSALVNNNIFAALAVKWDMHKYFKAISPSLFHVIEKFVVRQKDKEDEIDIEDDEDDNDAAKEHVELEVPKALGDIFESVAGAVYLDSGMSLDIVWHVYYRIMKPQIDKYLKSIPKSPVRQLLEQEPETAKFEKPARTMDGKIRVTVNVVGKGVFTGVGRNYRIAKSAAAKKALRCIKTLQQQGLI